MGTALNEIMSRFRDLYTMDLDGDVTGSAARQAFNAINYLKLVTSRDDTAQRALDDISQYIIHIEHKWLGR